ncbi:hypothetical protein F4820DRAFT_445710 [Hypoxylon rubiginosum]|uniref:Uncharacterized protein n=1 Tax=Hypoxylon rubiginosum TaxID=110542 RepID=A0ACB9Z865_9PEZI|nr:hypothetical protein F4820DRAFT_445710 [Hypoxylon rubiginosum]
MAKSKKGKQQAAPSKKEQIVSDWEEYFGSGDLPDWQRLMADLGFTEQFASKNQCRKALTHVWVNIRDFLDDTKAGREVHRFDNEKQLSDYTISEGKIYPKKKIQKGSPLQKLLAHIFSPRGRHRK